MKIQEGKQSYWLSVVAEYSKRPDKFAIVRAAELIANHTEILMADQAMKFADAFDTAKKDYMVSYNMDLQQISKAVEILRDTWYYAPHIVTNEGEKGEQTEPESSTPDRSGGFIPAGFSKKSNESPIPPRRNGGPPKTK